MVVLLIVVGMVTPIAVCSAFTDAISPGVACHWSTNSDTLVIKKVCNIPQTQVA